MHFQMLEDTANALVEDGKGILAADESSGTMKNRFGSIGVESTEENRRNYRECLFSTEGVDEFISGVILYDETIRQDSSGGIPLIDILTHKGIIPGVKVDAGLKDLSGTKSESVTEGIDGLSDRLAEYRDFGAKFTKWRAVLKIGSDTPSRYAINTNAHALARFASLSQEAGLVPIVEPEVIMDGSHDIEACFDATEATQREVYYQLAFHNVHLEGTLLKPNMVLSGKSAVTRADAEYVAERTITCFKRTIPSAVPGVVFLSGGQSDEEATVNLNAINQRAKSSCAPWKLSFSFGRGLQAAPLKAWRGMSDRNDKLQQAFRHRARLTSAATRGMYEPSMENDNSS